MNLRTFLRWWLRLLRPTTATVPAALALSAPVAPVSSEPLAYQYRSIETLLSLPTVTPDRSGYQRPDCGSVDAVMVWMVYERSNGWWRTPTHKVRDAAVYWLALRENVTGVRLS